MPRVWKFGDDVNTDDILPGKYAPFMVGEDRFHLYAFAHLRPGFAQEVRPGDILVMGRNAGLGSSREYAPEALKKLGVQAIVAKSYARIFFRNLVNLGIVPFQSEEVVDALEDGDLVELDLATGTLRKGERTYRLVPPPAFLLEALKEGSLLEYYKKHGRFPGEPG
ncbi:LeuD/DmdB family oxidoreductase small subunit [Thermus filiformis]|jgi:methanogen homoaconitase small subunit|uniref:3-isopropylmalate dehydratase small subunit n=1 Tax=Thermus filiformis TaxID=276 RepID=A0A0A2WNI3_THEFI|nr:homoaconitate hydratase [Thermus filiformis]KGQ21388.1 homoaconitate hydratase [Thermus filiformis]